MGEGVAQQRLAGKVAEVVNTSWAAISGESATTGPKCPAGRPLRSRA